MENLTIEILREIRDGIDRTRTALSERIDQTNERVERVERRVVESEVRVATAVTDVVYELRGFRRDLADGLDLRDRIERCERRVDALESNTGQTE